MAFFAIYPRTVLFKMWFIEMLNTQQLFFSNLISLEHPSTWSMNSFGCRALTCALSCVLVCSAEPCLRIVSKKAGPPQMLLEAVSQKTLAYCIPGDLSKNVCKSMFKKKEAAHTLVTGRMHCSALKGTPQSSENKGVAVTHTL